ncbi:hypothetical protein [Methylocystis sp. Sn-Cys]|uniref:hypothetical protein n=1 Tax=Methylocystis sp. Sn-Cys TaxID=1701263 RepID=UPI001921A66E|nr:hypothetical protein [Methylocystis sp. Sn-Cys]MBL1255428.1 hypothetical protein [Methylocystis sp. Sn-Cys]
MIADYRFYHGVVLAELVNLKAGAIAIDVISEDGRFSSYVLDGEIGLQIKHCANRLHPWQFTFTKANLVDLLALQQAYKCVFVVLVCHTDGIVTLSLDEATGILAGGESEQAWIRVDRRRNEWYSVTGGAAELIGKRPSGVKKIIQALSEKR